jgi:hypothetical protein
VAAGCRCSIARLYRAAHAEVLLVRDDLDPLVAALGSDERARLLGARIVHDVHAVDLRPDAREDAEDVLAYPVCRDDDRDSKRHSRRRLDHLGSEHIGARVAIRALRARSLGSADPVRCGAWYFRAAAEEAAGAMMRAVASAPGRMPPRVARCSGRRAERQRGRRSCSRSHIWS